MPRPPVEYGVNTKQDPDRVFHWNKHMDDHAKKHPYIIKTDKSGRPLVKPMDERERLARLKALQNEMETLQSGQPVKETKPDTMITLIVEKIGELEVTNKDHFTKSGIPRLEALEALLEAPVKPEERDEAWKIYLGDD